MHLIGDRSPAVYRFHGPAAKLATLGRAFAWESVRHPFDRPILVRISFLDYITDLLGKRQQPQFELSPMDNPHPLRAYEITLQELTKRRDGV